MIDPRGLDITDWADSVLLVVGGTFSFGKLVDPDKWQDWAVAFVAAQPFAQQGVPDPYQFTDWREWAMRSYTMLEGQG
jgi:hypothetical protein